MSDPIEVKASLAAKEITPHPNPYNELVRHIIARDSVIIARHYRELVAPLVEAARAVLDECRRGGNVGTLATDKLTRILRDYPAPGPAGQDKP